MNKTYSLILGLLTLMYIMTGCGKTQTIERTGYALGTVIDIKLYEYTNEEILDEVFDELEKIDQLMSTSLEGSDLMNINRAAQDMSVQHQIVSVEMDLEVIQVIQRGLTYGEMTGGYFDITFGPVVSLWGIGTESEHVPSLNDIEKTLALVDYRKVKVSDNQVYIDGGMALDLGGIAKGYAADQVADILVEAGVKSALINLGGNIRVIGTKEQEVPFKIGIQDPSSERNDYLGVVDVSDVTVVTSGDYERYFEEDGIRYHHIFDKETGYPVWNDIASVTIIAESSMDADALSTSVYALGIEKGIELVKNIENAGCIIVSKNGQIYFSDMDIYHMFDLKDNRYKIIKPDVEVE